MVKRIVRTKHLKDKLKLLEGIIKKQRIALEDQLNNEVGMVEYLESNYNQIKDVNNYLRRVRSSRINSKKGSMINSIRSSNYIQNFNLNQNALGPNIAFIHTGKYALNHTPPVNREDNLVVIRDEDDHFKKINRLGPEIYTTGGLNQISAGRLGSMSSTKSKGEVGGSMQRLRNTLLHGKKRFKNNASSNLLRGGKKGINNFSLNVDKKMRGKIGNRSLDRFGGQNSGNFFKKIQDNFINNSPVKRPGLTKKKAKSSRKGPEPEILPFSTDKVKVSTKRMRLKSKPKRFKDLEQVMDTRNVGSSLDSQTNKKLNQKLREKVMRSQKLKKPKKSNRANKSSNKNTSRGKMLIESLGKAFNKNMTDKNQRTQKRRSSPRKPRKTGPKGQRPAPKPQKPAPKAQEESFIKVRISNNNSKIDSEIAEVSPRGRIMMSTTPKYTKHILPENILDDRAQSLISMTMDSEKEAEMQRQMAIRDSPRRKREMEEHDKRSKGLEIKVNDNVFSMRHSPEKNENRIGVSVGNNMKIDLFQMGGNNLLFESQKFD